MRAVYYTFSLIFFVFVLIIYFQNIGTGSTVYFLGGQLSFSFFYVLLFFAGLAIGAMMALAIKSYLSDTELENEGLDI